MISCNTKIVKFPHCVYIVDYQVWFSYRPHSQEWTLSSGGSFHQMWGCFLRPQTSWPRNGLSGLCIYWRLMYRVGAVCGGQSNSSLEVWWVRRRKARYSQSLVFAIFAKNLQSRVENQKRRIKQLAICCQSLSLSVWESFPW